jgi:hypothetical protein
MNGTEDGYRALFERAAADAGTQDYDLDRAWGDLIGRLTRGTASASGKGERSARRTWIRRSPRITLTVAMTAIVVAGATVVALRSHQPSGTTSRTPTKVSKLDDTLWAISQRAAISGGDPSAYDRQAVGPLPLGRASRLTTGDGPVSSTELVYIIELRGNFVCRGCSTPQAGQPPTGDVTILDIDASTFGSIGYGLSNIWYNLDRLGKAFTLVAPPGGLTPLQQNPEMTPFVGEWTSSSGLLHVTATGGQLTYGPATCPVPTGSRPACDSIRFKVKYSILSSTPRPRGDRGSRQGPCANGGRCGSAVGGPIESDNVGLAVGTRITLWAELDDEVEVIIAGAPSVPVPSRWCGPRAPKGAC